MPYPQRNAQFHTKVASNLRSQTVTTSKILVRRDWNSPRPNRPVIAAGGMTDFGRAAHNNDATGVAKLAARAHEGMAAAASAGLSTPRPQIGSAMATLSLIALSEKLLRMDLTAGSLRSFSISRVEK